MHDLAAFDVDDLVGLSEEFAILAKGTSSMEEVGQRVVDHLYRHLRSGGEPASALVRLYHTVKADRLDVDLRAAAEAVGGPAVDGGTPCLTLLASAGPVPAWNDRRRSDDHRAVPLVDEHAVDRSPMIAAFLRQLGVSFGDLVDGGEQPHHRHYGVFFVEDAVGSTLIPAQDDFVVPYGIRSVIGVGGFLPSGDLFALVVFLTVAVPESVAELFRTVALSLKATLTPFTYRIFEAASQH